MPESPEGRRKIAHIVSRFPKLTETFVLYELLELERRGVEISLYSLLRHRDPVVHEEAGKLARRAHYSKFLSFPIVGAVAHYARSRPGKLFRAVREVLLGTSGSLKFLTRAMAIFPKSILFGREMEREGITHVHAHFATHATVAALIVHRLTDIPFSFTARGSDVHVNRCMLRQKVEAADFVIAVSEQNRAVILDECGAVFRNKLHVIYGGIDVDLFAPRPAAERSGSFTILCVASLEEVKGHRYLIEACRILSARGLDYECHLVGEGSLRRRIVRQIESRGLRDAFHLHGACTRAEIVERCAAADVFVLATAPTSSGRQEGIPNVLKEAMACGLPVVACRAGGIPELVEHGRTGLLVPPRDAAAMADALTDLRGDDILRRRLGTAARRRILRDFDLGRSVSRRASLFLADRSDRRLVATE